MNMDLVIDGLAVIGAGTCLWWAVRVLGAFLGWIERSEIARQAAEASSGSTGARAAGVSAAAISGGIPAEHVAAIAAAVTMAMEGHRVVLIEDKASGQAWTSEGRWQHQTSHRVH